VFTIDRTSGSENDSALEILGEPSNGI